MNILVTGATGFLGSNVVSVLLSQGHRVRCLVRTTSSLSLLDPQSVEVAYGSIFQKDQIEKALEGMDALVHCAGITHARTREEFLQVNCVGTYTVLEACLAHADTIKRIVCVASLAAIGPSVHGMPVAETSDPHPVSSYGISKLAGMRVAEFFMEKLPITIIIPPAIYGPGDRAIYVYFKMLKLGIMPLVGKGEQCMSLAYVGDVARAISLCLTHEKSAGKSFFVEDGDVHTWKSFAMVIKASMQKRALTLRFPIVAAHALGIASDLFSHITASASLLGSDKVNELLQNAWVCSSRKIRDELGFVSVYSVNKGVGETVEWYKARGWL